MNMYVYGWVAVRFVGFVWVGLVWLWVELINLAKEGRNIARTYESYEYKKKLVLIGMNAKWDYR